MAVKYGSKKLRHNNIFYTLVTSLLLFMVFLSMVAFFYNNAEEEAYENLHRQTKQIKDDMQLQFVSDRENLETMANFAAKLHSDGESYTLLLNSFKPIGLIENIGILTPDNILITKAGTVSLSRHISFADEVKRGKYISGRVVDYTDTSREIIRSAVPIRANGDTVGILYGVIKLGALSDRYHKMAKELDAQLFVYDKESGNLVLDTINDTLGNISFLKERKYNKGYSYEQMMSNDRGFTSFVSAYTGEDLYMHYAPLEELGWGITLARYESQVFAKTHIITRKLFISFLIMVLIMALYMLIVMAKDRRAHSVMTCASTVRKLLLEMHQQHDNITNALKHICLFSGARSAILVDTDSEDCNYIMPSYEEKLLMGKDRAYFIQELIKYATEFHRITNAAVNVMCITPNKHLVKTNIKLYEFMKKHSIREVSFAAVIDENNYISILGAINPQKSRAARELFADVSVCFSIALYNKNHLNRTELAATTDGLTGALNRVAYKKDLLVFDEEKPSEFSCIYIDVNELHLRNNKYGHAAGDEMLLYIANTLKEVFYGQRIYRMGGDEFLVFAHNIDQEAVKNGIKRLVNQLKPMDYHVAIGVSYRTQNTNTEEMVREAEIRMYEAKAQYYQNKQQNTAKVKINDYVQTKTGICEIDTMLSVLQEHYNGIYRVSLDMDTAHRILMPAYLGYNEDEEHFSKLMNKYIAEMVNPDFHRAVMSFLNYDALKHQLTEGKSPKIKYKKNTGETVILSVYKLNEEEVSANNTLWVFAKD